MTIKSMFNEVEAPKISDRVTAFETAIADCANVAIRAEIVRALNTYRAHVRFFDNDAKSTFAVIDQWVVGPRRGQAGYTAEGAEIIIAICA